MEVTLLNTNHMPNGWLAGQLTGIWKDLARDLDGRTEKAHYAPAADIVEDTDSYQFSFEMAGLKKDSVDVRVEDGHLITQAERVRPELAKEGSASERAHLWTESAHFQDARTRATEGIAATYRDGILEVRVPKKPETKPLRIKVNAD